MISFFICLFSIHSFAQEDEEKFVHSEFSTRIGFNSLNEINLYYTYRRKEKIDLLFSIGVNYGSELFTDVNFLFCSVKGISEHFSKKGFIIRTGFSIPKKAGSTASRGNLFVVYRRAKAKNIVWDAGCTSGSNSSDYEKYDLYRNDIGIAYYYDIPLGKSPVSFYLAGGLGLSTKLKKYKLKGSFTNPLPSNEVTREFVPFIVHDIGFKLTFLKLKS